MYVIELIIKQTAMPMSVQRKTVEDANSVYEQVLSAIEAGKHELLKLTCERQPEKRIAVFADDIVAAQIYEKSGAASSGKATGFMAFAES
jgi:hypothetical protein